MRLLVATLVVVATGCADTLMQPENGTGPFEGRWNGRTWKGRGFAVLVDDTLYLIGHRRPDPRYFNDEYVRVRMPFDGERRYTIDSGYASLEHVVGGDAGYFPSARGLLTITDVDQARTQVRGMVVLSSTAPSLEWTFEDGRFLLPIHTSFSDGWRALGNAGVPRGFPRSIF
jgi:hypothetical protein